MQWEQLLSLRRFGDAGSRLRSDQDETRLGFEVDFDRVIFSSAFRSLQDKTQVIPLPKITGSGTDFVHTRLTHSLEVSVVGRSLGRLAGQRILKLHPELERDLGYRFGDMGAIVAAASLAHDIGNPPFGHSGESAIGRFFKDGEGRNYKSLLTDIEFRDLTNFEGNANGFRLLTQSRSGVEGGLRLSFATLGAFTKYPKGSLPHQPSTHIADKKFGFFQTEKEFFVELAMDLGLPKRGSENFAGFGRHPLAFLVEAADDICYTIIDFEDGINLGWIGEEYALEYLINLVKDRINTQKFNALEYMADRLSYLRALAINTLINDAVEIFISNEKAILEGTFQDSLLTKSKYKAQIDDIIAISVKNIYRSREVIDKEITGFRMISDILNTYVLALMGQKEGKASAYDKLLIKTLPGIYRSTEGTVYEILLNAACFVASLSDSGAVQVHRKITGFQNR